ncbi:MAG TPA: FAD-dependent oxidoreductase [Mycobacteriales bacterium]|jgi:D-amino-acid dehydrogenase
MSGPRVAVVGSGVAGASTAFALAAGGAEVVVVDRVLPGQATAAGAGIIQPWSSGADGSTYELYAAGAAYYPTLIERLAAVGVSDIGYRVAGSLVVHADAAKLDDAEELLRRRTAGVAVAGTVGRLSGRDARALFPPLAPDLGAVHVSGGARVDGRLLRSGLLAGARRHGAVMVDAPARLAPAPTGTWAVHTPGGDLGADVVVVAAGAWVNSVLEPLGHRLAVEPQRGQIAHLLLEGRESADWPSVLPLASHYIVPFDAGRIVVGATRETGSGFDARLTAGGVLEVLSNALSVAPGLAAASLIETRVGLRPLAGEHGPFLGPLADHPTLFVNAGFGPAGLTMAPLAGAALAQLILTGSSDLDLRAFAPPEPSRER